MLILVIDTSFQEDLSAARSFTPQFFSGEGGIRTHGALRLTRSPGARIRPDYATSPIINILLYFLRAELYYRVFKADS